MYRWLEKDLQGINPSQTPWVIVAFHSPWYSTYMGSYRENAEMQHSMEPLFRNYNVDLVISGHVHAYDRSVPVFDNTVDSCGIVHIVLGSGNAEGLTQGYIDTTEYTYSHVKVSDLCHDPETYFTCLLYTSDDPRIPTNIHWKRTYTSEWTILLRLSSPMVRLQRTILWPWNHYYSE